MRDLGRGGRGRCRRVGVQQHVRSVTRVKMKRCDLGCQSWAPLPTHFLGRNFLGLWSPKRKTVLHRSVNGGGKRGWSGVRGLRPPSRVRAIDFTLNCPLASSLGA